ncbi:MAG TPA: YeeE/YedE family protein [Usitatibacter sp.]|nr:YeeE/YedE family protein [Usitatibacter sp.]
MGSTSSAGAVVAWGGFVLAFIFGFVANRTNFCTMGAVSDVVNMGSWGRMRMWLLAIAVAILGSHALQLLGLVDLGKSIYVRPNVTWLSYVLGGFLFGVGMTLGSGCGSKTLIRVGGGSLKSLVVFIFLGIAAYMTLKGLFAIWRVTWIDPVATNLAAANVPRQDLPTMLAALTGGNLRVVEAITALLVGAALLAFVFKDREFRRSFDHILGGTVVGLVVVGGWYVTGHLGFGENPETLEETFFGTNSHTLESLSFVAPVAYALELLMLWSDKSLTVTFGVATAAGIILGSFAYAVLSRSFRWEGFAGPEDTANHVIGGLLMGFGGVTALGCTIGQGLTGFSTLAIGSILAFVAIVAGSALTMKWQYWRMSRDA